MDNSSYIKDISISMINLIDGTNVKVDYSCGSTTFYFHGTSPLISFDLFRHHTKEDLEKSFREAVEALETYKKEIKL